ncbi:MAG: hypothetical protein ACOC4M_18315, partial [Promethearchaeia archaeon]
GGSMIRMSTNFKSNVDYSRRRGIFYVKYFIIINYYSYIIEFIAHLSLSITRFDENLFFLGINIGRRNLRKKEKGK